MRLGDEDAGTAVQPDQHGPAGATNSLNPVAELNDVTKVYGGGMLSRGSAVALDGVSLTRSKSERQEMMMSALEAVGLRPDETLGRYPHQLSGGQRQRIIVADTPELDGRDVGRLLELS